MLKRVGSAVAKFASLVFILAMMLASHPDVAIASVESADGQLEVVVVEYLRIKVPADGRQAWIEAEQGSWEPWLAQQDGFVGRDLLWDAEREEGTLLIRWASREQWKAIPEQEVDMVQARFEELARDATGLRQGNPFPLVFEGELVPQ